MILLDFYSIPMESIGFLLDSYGFYEKSIEVLWTLFAFYWIPLDSIGILGDPFEFY